MNSEKRKRSRIQGGWASHASQQSKSSSVSQIRSAPVVRLDQPRTVSTQDNGNDIKGTTLLTTTSDAAPVSAKFTFQADSATLQKEPVLKVINSPGDYVISTEPSGTSSIKLIHNFIDSAECDWIFDQIRLEVPWKQQTAMKSGDTYLQPRLTAWFGEHPYSYSGISHEQNEQWAPTIQMLKDRIEEITGYIFNSVLANLYRDGHDHVAWHSDDEVSLGIQPTIASLSFGDTRNFELRKKPLQGGKDPNDMDYSEYIKVPLDAGSLLIMEGCLQQDWQHRIPSEYHDRGPRINLTYRMILPST